MPANMLNAAAGLAAQSQKLVSKPRVLTTPEGRRESILQVISEAGPENCLYPLLTSCWLNDGYVDLLVHQPTEWHTGRLHLAQAHTVDRATFGLLPEFPLPTLRGDKRYFFNTADVNVALKTDWFTSNDNPFDICQVAPAVSNLIQRNGSIGGVSYRYRNEPFHFYLQRIGVIGAPGDRRYRPVWDNRPGQEDYVKHDFVSIRSVKPYTSFVAGWTPSTQMSVEELRRAMTAMDQAVHWAAYEGDEGATAILHYNFATSAAANLGDHWLDWLLCHILTLQGQFTTVKLLIDDAEDSVTGFYLVAQGYQCKDEIYTEPWLDAIESETMYVHANKSRVNERQIMPCFVFPAEARNQLLKILHELDTYRLRRLSFTYGPYAYKSVQNTAGRALKHYDYNSGTVHCLPAFDFVMAEVCDCQCCRSMWDRSDPKQFSEERGSSKFHKLCNELKTLMVQGTVNLVRKQQEGLTSRRKFILEFGGGFGSVLKYANNAPDVHFVVVDRDPSMISHLREKVQVRGLKNVTVHHVDLNCAIQRKKFFSQQAIHYVFSFWSYQFMSLELKHFFNERGIPMMTLAMVLPADKQLTEIHYEGVCEVRFSSSWKTASVWVRNLYADSFTEPLIPYDELQPVSDVLPCFPRGGIWDYVRVGVGVHRALKNDRTKASDFFRGVIMGTPYDAGPDKLVLTPGLIDPLVINTRPILERYGREFEIKKTTIIRDFTGGTAFFVEYDQLFQVQSRVPKDQRTKLTDIVEKYLPRSYRLPTIYGIIPDLMYLWSRFAVSRILTEVTSVLEPTRVEVVLDPDDDFVELRQFALKQVKPLVPLQLTQ